TGAPVSDAGKRGFASSAPFSTPALQQFGTQLVFPRDFAGGSAGVQCSHGRDFEIAAVDSSGQIHFLTPFNVFVPLTHCLNFGVHSILKRLPLVSTLPRD